MNKLHIKFNYENIVTLTKISRFICYLCSRHDETKYVFSILYIQIKIIEIKTQEK